MHIDGPTIQDREHMIWIADLPGYWAGKDPAKVAMVFGDRSVTYTQFAHGAARLCALWQEQGYKTGDRIAYFGRNSALFYHVYFACAMGGFVLASINWRYAAPELAFVLSDAEPRLLIHDADFSALVDQACAGLVKVPARLLVESAQGDSLRSLIEGPALAVAQRTRSFDEPLVQMYTSGTTGSPKGALVSHGAQSLFRNSYDSTPYWEDWKSSDVILSAMPNFHIAGIGFVLIGMGAGATIIHTADPAPANLVKLSNQHQVDRIYMVPTIIQMVLDELQNQGGKVPRYKGIYYGAQPIGPTLLARAIDTFGCRFTQYYGMTEAATTHVLGPAEHDLARPHLMKSVGQPIAGVSAEIRRVDGSVCAAGEAGEIWIKSEMLMLCYANRPEATAEAIVDGWYRTGDGGFVDAQGFLYLTDRLKDMVITGGENVYPVEVENALKTHPRIKDVAVVGTADAKWGEAVTAVVELKPGERPSFEELRAYVKERLAGYKCPRLVFVADALPRTPSGKVQRGASKKLIPQLDRLA